MNREAIRPAAPTPERALAELRVLHALAETINRSTAPGPVYAEALAALRWTTGADRLAVLLMDPEGIMRFAASDGLSAAYRAAVEGHCPWAANEAFAQPIVVRDPAREPTLARLLPLLHAEGIASLTFIPIAHQNQLLGKFMLYFNAPHEPSDEEIRLSLTVAEYLALAISRQRAVDETRRLNAELEQRVAQRTRQLEEANREMESFCYSVSHDLRAPLRALDGFARILLEDAADVLGDDDKDKLRRIVAASGRMSELIDDLLAFSRVGRADLRPTVVDLGRLVREIATRLEGSEPGRKTEWRVDDGLTARADANLMRLALENLLDNAWKYSRGQAVTRIEVGVRENGGERVFFVRDNGTGFDMRYATKLFSPFQRMHSPGEFEGNGIGLAVVQRIVQRHGGRIWAESAPGAGSAFYFTLWPGGVPAGAEEPAFSPPSSRSA